MDYSTLSKKTEESSRGNPCPLRGYKMQKLQIKNQAFQAVVTTTLRKVQSPGERKLTGRGHGWHERRVRQKDIRKEKRGKMPGHDTCIVQEKRLAVVDHCLVHTKGNTKG